MGIPPLGALHGRSGLGVVLFSGGRGADALVRPLIRNPAIQLTVVINGYDDGASTGEVRRFLGDSLGPSDFRKNASRLASELGTAPAELIAFLDKRLPAECDRAAADAILRAAGSEEQAAAPPWGSIIGTRLAAFRLELERTKHPFDFRDCSLGNLVFAGAFLLAGRDFNAAVADYCRLLGLPSGLIQNVTDGTNAYLVATGIDGRFLASEETLVDATRQNEIDQIYLIDHAIGDSEREMVAGLSAAARNAFLTQHAANVRANPAVVDVLRHADLIIYAPGTQHSSLFPSYLTPGLSTVIADNHQAIKLVVTNLQQDAEIAGASAVDIIDRALYYLRDKGRLTIPTPCLVTHYLLNDPRSESPNGYVPLGAIDAIEDPRLVRIGAYEDGVTGRHDAERVLGPFVQSLLDPHPEPTVAVYLHDADSPNKLTQTLLEMVRGGVADLPLKLTAIHPGTPLDERFASTLPFAVQSVPRHQAVEFLRTGHFEYVVLMESSGMYRGEDIVALGSQLAFVKLDGVWGSRRLSLKDMEQAFRLQYQHRWLLKAASRFGSHVLSLMYLMLYGRYISDTLSGFRAVRVQYLDELDVDPAHKLANHQILTALLRHRAEVLEIPVRFFPISPERVKRTSVLEGLRAMLEILVLRLRPKASRAMPTHEKEIVSRDKTATAGKA
jgi:2-phospho-L-lactate transferase/gluconeogenesis factor (CofD/UPF0052 family)